MIAHIIVRLEDGNDLHLNLHVEQDQYEQLADKIGEPVEFAMTVGGRNLTTQPGILGALHVHAANIG